MSRKPRATRPHIESDDDFDPGAGSVPDQDSDGLVPDSDVEPDRGKKRVMRDAIPPKPAKSKKARLPRKAAMPVVFAAIDNKSRPELLSGVRRRQLSKNTSLLKK